FERGQPQPFVLRQKCKRARVRVQVREPLIADVLVPANLRLDALVGNGAPQILPRVAAVVADDVERGLGMCPCDRRERADQIDHVAAVEDRTDEQDAGAGGWGLGAGCSAPDTGHDAPRGGASPRPRTPGPYS